MVSLMTAHSRSRSPAPPQSDSGPQRSNAVDFELALEVLSDEYACELLRALTDGQKAAGELIEHCGMSRPTVYRRLDTMVEAGIVDCRQSSTADDRQCNEYHLAVDTVEFTLHPDGVTGAVPTDCPDR